MKKNTELCVDLKTFLNDEVLMKPGKKYHGTLKRDKPTEANGFDNRHYTFVQDAPQKAKPRNQRPYRGNCINVIIKPDGNCYLTLNRPHYTETYTFEDFCSEAINEIYIAMSLVRMIGSDQQSQMRG